MLGSYAVPVGPRLVVVFILVAAALWLLYVIWLYRRYNHVSPRRSWRRACSWPTCCAPHRRGSPGLGDLLSGTKVALDADVHSASSVTRGA